MRPRATIWPLFERALSLLAVAALFAIPAMDKVFGPYPPAWFAKKFEATVINAFPGSMAIAFVLIAVAEVVVPLLCLVALVRGEFRPPETDDERPPTWSDFAFAGAMLLLFALTVGSLIARDYDNAFHDFGYLVGVAVMRRLFFA